MIFELLQLVVTFILSIVSISDGSQRNCAGTSSCPGGGIQIEAPFWIPSDTAYTGCTYPGFAIKCEGARPVMNISNHLYYVLDIDESIITLMDADMDGEKCPRPRHKVSLQSQPFLRSYIQDQNLDQNLGIFYNCTIPPGNGWYQLICLENFYNNKTRRSYAFSSPEGIPQEFQHWYNYCEESVVVPAYFDRTTNISKSIESFRLSYRDPVDCDDCVLSGGRCSANQTATGGAFSCQCPRIGTRENRICYSYEGLRKVEVITMYVSIGVPVLLLIVLLIYIRSISHWLYNLILSWKNKIDRLANVEAFLENYGCLSLQRYKYIDVKKMTNSFKETLGQGGYGIVYKGKLHDDCLVAVKVLNESKGNGEEFINEVAAIGRTNHVNIVSLLGFCTEGKKRALVYEFMANGSLERFIYNNHQSSTTSTHPLGWEKLYDIALGVSKGLEYLHRGCNTRILHLDIKPHNILLDHNFFPKISDFGLAKLCPTLASVVSMVGPRGTMGYIAPEVYCRNFGGVSHKSDVYSYGMMVLEMIGGRKNIDVTVENISEIYFPQWIYNHFEQGNKVHDSEEGKIEGHGEIFGDEKAKKMIIVALWCIQAHPIDRPSMRKVAEMLEGNIDELQMPPNPNMGPQSEHPPSP